METAEQEAKKSKSPVWFLIGLFLALILVLMVIPGYVVKLDPEPRDIPGIDELDFLEIKVGSGVEVDNVDYKSLVDKRNKNVKSAADYIVSQSCVGSNKVCHAKALYYFVRDNIDYVSDPIGVEYVELPEEMLVKKGGDCESGSLLLANLVESVGIDAQLVFIFKHAYVRVRIDDASDKYKTDDWIYLDWTCSDCEFGQIPWQNYRKQAEFLDV